MNGAPSSYGLQDALHNEILALVERALRGAAEQGGGISERAETELLQRCQEAAIFTAAVLVLYALLFRESGAMLSTVAATGAAYLRRRPDLLEQLTAVDMEAQAPGMGEVLRWLQQAAAVDAPDQIPPFPLASGSL